MTRQSSKKKPFEDEPALDFSGAGPDLDRESGDAAADSLPIRTCVVERARRPRSELLRFVLAPDGSVVPDLKGKLPGRGVWLTPERKAVEEAVRRRAFNRAFRKEVAVDADLPDRVEALLRKAAVDALSLANKAGLVVTGFEKVQQAIARREIVILLHAIEAASDGISKLNRRFAGAAGGKSYTEPLICLTSAEISLATGRTNVIHAGLKEGGASRAFLRAIQHLLRYRGQPLQADEPVQDKE